MSEPVFSIREKESDVFNDFNDSIVFYWRSDGLANHVSMSALKMVSIIETYAKQMQEEAEKDGHTAIWRC